MNCHRFLGTLIKKAIKIFSTNQTIFVKFVKNFPLKISSYMVNLNAILLGKNAVNEERKFCESQFFLTNASSNGNTCTDYAKIVQVFPTCHSNKAK